jgi:hypothetical protein
MAFFDKRLFTPLQIQREAFFFSTTVNRMVYLRSLVARKQIYNGAGREKVE